MSSTMVRNFMKQQGFAEEVDSVCDMHFSGLSFQPKILGLLVVIAILLRSPSLFFVLSAGLWWNVAFPKWNLFEIFYNRVVCRARARFGRSRPMQLPDQPASQALALLFSLASRSWLPLRIHLRVIPQPISREHATIGQTL